MSATPYETDAGASREPRSDDAGEERHRTKREPLQGNTPAERRADDKRRLEAAVAAGEIEPTKTFTKYACLDCGKSSLWTGSLGPDRCFDGLSGRFCSLCGAQLVEEGPKRFTVHFESINPLAHTELYDWNTERARKDLDWSTIPEDWWTPNSRTDSEHGARQQFDGLLQLIGEGELIRNVRVVEVPDDPVGIDITDKWSA